MTRTIGARTLARTEYMTMEHVPQLLGLTLLVVADDFGRVRRSTLSGWVHRTSPADWQALADHGFALLYGDFIAYPYWFVDFEPTPRSLSLIPDPPDVITPEGQSYLERCRWWSTDIVARREHRRTIAEVNRSIAVGNAVSPLGIELMAFVQHNGGAWIDHEARDWLTLYLAFGKERLAELMAAAAPLASRRRVADVIRIAYRPTRTP